MVEAPKSEIYPPEIVFLWMAGLLQNVCSMQPACPVHLVTLCNLLFLVLPITAPSMCRCSFNQLLIQNFHGINASVDTTDVFVGSVLATSDMEL